jgi:hypothetical protein
MAVRRVASTVTLAQREESTPGYRQRSFDFKVDVLIGITLSTEGG